MLDLSLGIIIFTNHSGTPSSCHVTPDIGNGQTRGCIIYPSISDFPTFRVSVPQYQPPKYDSIFLAQTRWRTGLISTETRYDRSADHLASQFGPMILLRPLSSTPNDHHRIRQLEPRASIPCTHSRVQDVRLRFLPGHTAHR